MDLPVTTADAKPTGDIEPAAGTLKWLILLTVIIGTFLGRLDQTIVNLALPKIIEDFHITVSGSGWIATAYIIANAVFVPIWGKLGDTIGRKRVYIAGFSIFIVGSVLAGLSWNLGSMIVFRVIQAIASSADYPTAMAILAFTFTTEKQRAQALGIWSSSFVAASIFGPLIGGPLIDSFGWRSVFLVNLPVGIVGMIMALSFIHESKSEKKTINFDWWGAIALGTALTTLSLVLDQGQTWGWLSFWSVICYVGTVIALLLFIAIEYDHPEPIVDLKFFKNSVFVNVLLNNFIVFMGLIGGLFLIPIFAQIFLGYTATQAGYLFIPMALALLVGAPIGGAMVGRLEDRWVIIVSTVIGALGVFFLAGIDPRSGPWAIMAPLMVMAFGLGLGMAQRTNAIAVIVPKNEIGVASSILALVRNIAGAFGISLFATLLDYLTNHDVLNLARSATMSTANISNQVSAILPSTVTASAASIQGTFVQLIILKAEVMGYSQVFLVTSVIVLLGSISAYWIKTGKMKPGVKVHMEM
jgi:DHA2 family multidrug resistance protein